MLRDGKNLVCFCSIDEINLHIGQPKSTKSVKVKITTCNLTFDCDAALSNLIPAGKLEVRYLLRPYSWSGKW